jgi:phage terminase large subunit-like protein
LLWEKGGFWEILCVTESKRRDENSIHNKYLIVGVDYVCCNDKNDILMLFERQRPRFLFILGRKHWIKGREKNERKGHFPYFQAGAEAIYRDI